MKITGYLTQNSQLGSEHIPKVIKRHAFHKRLKYHVVKAPIVTTLVSLVFLNEVPTLV